MNITIKKNNYLHHLLAIILFAAITLFYCWPIFNGNQINQSDYKQFLGMSKEIVDFRAETGDEALWTNSMFGGMPAYQISVHYANNILIHIDKLFQLYLPRPIGIMFLYFIGFYILLLSMRLNPQFAILGALAFGFSTYFFIIIEVGHNTKAHAIAYISPALAGMIHCFRKENHTLLKKIPGLFLSFLFLGLHLRGNHLQISYYFLFIILGFWINYLLIALRNKHIYNFIRSSLVFIIAGILAISINIGNIWSTYEYSKYTTRGMSELKAVSSNQTTGLDKDYATSYSYGKLETFNLLFPNFFGGSSVGHLSEKSHVYKVLRQNRVSQKDSKQLIQQLPLYFGPQQFTAGPVYIGAVVWLLFFIGLFTIKKTIKWVLLSLVFFSFLLAWGKYFPLLTNFFLDYFPLYNKFRTVSMILIIAEFAIPLLGILGFFQLCIENIATNNKLRILIKSSGILLVIGLFFLLFGKLVIDFSSSADGQFPLWFSNALIKDRIALFNADIIRSLLFVIAATFIIYLGISGYFKSKFIWIHILSFLVIADMWFVNKRYFNTEDFVSKNKINTPFEVQDYDRLIKQDTTVYRVYNLNERLDQGARTSYFHHSLGGYHGAKLGKYQELIDRHIARGNMEVINMLNTKYIINSDENRKPFVQENPFTLGNAWFINNLQWVSNADEEINYLDSISTKETAIINKEYKMEIPSFNFNKENVIELSSYAPNKLIYHASIKETAFVVFSEIFYPKGWEAYINDSPVNYYPVNYLLRGLVLPEGESEIIFQFRPKSFFVSSKITLFASCVLVILALVVCVRFILNKQ